MKVKIKLAAKKKYGIKGNQIDFEELEKKIILSLARDNLDKAVKIARETGLSKMSNKEINQIIKETRQRASARN